MLTAKHGDGLVLHTSDGTIAIQVGCFLPNSLKVRFGVKAPKEVRIDHLHRDDEQLRTIWGPVEEAT